MKVCFRYIKVSLKGVQTSLQNTITWINFFGKGDISGRILALLLGWRLELKTSYQNKVCPLKVLFFQHSLKFQDVTFIRYGQQHASYLSLKVSIGQTWAIVQTICDTLLPILKQCVFEIEPRLLVIVRHANFHFHLVLSFEN